MKWHIKAPKVPAKARAIRPCVFVVFFERQRQTGRNKSKMTRVGEIPAFARNTVVIAVDVIRAAPRFSAVDVQSCAFILGLL